MKKFRKFVYICFVIELIVITYGICTGVYDDSMIVVAVKNLFAQ